MNKSLLILLLTSAIGYSQAPNISYTTPTSFAINTNNYLAPTNTGGTVQAGRIVSSFAGSGTMGAADGVGTEASFNLPTVVTLDSQQNIYVVDRSNNKIRKITPTGIVTTIAGTGDFGSADGLALEATFFYPDGAVVDSQDNLFVSDQSNHIIRKITPDGWVTTFAGTGNYGAIDGPGATAQFYYPAGMAIDSNDILYVADYGNHKIRKITPNGEVSTYAGSGAQGDIDGLADQAQFNLLTGVVVDAAHNVYACDYGNHRIKKINDYGYSISPALPEGLTFDTATGIISGTPISISDPINYTISATNPYGESTVEVSIAIGELSNPSFQTRPLIFYPNPSQDSLTIENSMPMDAISITNTLGQTILDFYSTPATFQFSTASLPKGCYILKTILGSKVEVNTFIKK